MSKRTLKFYNLLAKLPAGLLDFLEFYETQAIENYKEDSDVELFVVKSISDLDMDKVNKNALILVEEINHNEITRSRNILNIKLLNYPLVHKLAYRVLESDSSAQVEQAFKESVSHFESFKVTDHYQTGYYADLATLVSLREGFNFLSIRLYLTYISTFFTYLRQANQILLPIDFDLAGDENTFMIQAHCNAESFQIESLLQALEGKDVNNPATGLIAQCSAYSHLIDFYFLEKTSRLVITSMWVKSEENLHASQGTLFKIYQQFSGGVGKSIIAETKEVLKAQDVEAVDRETPLPGDGYKTVKKASGGEEIIDATTKEKPMARKLNEIVSYILDENENGIFTYQRKVFDKELIDLFLKIYPDQSIVDQLIEKNKEYILNSIKDDNYLEILKDKVSDKDTSRMTEVFSQSIKENLQDEKISAEINKQREAQGQEQLDITKVANDIEAELLEQKDKFKNVEELQDHATALMEKLLNAPPQNIQALVNNVMSESLQTYIDELENTSDDSKVDKAVVVKMMRVIQGLKKKIMALEADTSPREISERESGLVPSGKDYESLAELNQMKQKMAGIDAIIENKNKQISELSLKLDKLMKSKDESTDDYIDTDDTNTDVLKKNIRTLEGQLELYKERVAILSEKLDKSGAKGELLYSDGKVSTGSEALPKQLGSSPEAIKLSSLEDKYSQLEKRYSKLEDRKNGEIQQLREQLLKATSNRAKSNTKAFESKILLMKQQHKKTEDELKGVKLLHKKLQAKYKHAQGQIAALQKNNEAVRNEKNTPNKAEEAKFALRIKQLETLSQKASNQAKKAEKELLARKTENAKLKQEIGGLRNKLAEAERKLNKKAA